MNRHYFFLFLSICFSIFANAQPGPIFLNLNDGLGDIIIIDSTTNRSRIALLKNHKRLHVVIALFEIPEEFKDFTQVASLTIVPPKNIDKLDSYFPNLKHLTIRNVKRKYVAKKKFQLDSLKSLYIMDSEDLENMDAFLNCNTIEKLLIRGTPNLIRFPKFRKKNNIKELIIDHGITFRKKDTVNYLKTIQRLSKLERLTLANIYSLTEIPSYLPETIQHLEVNSWALHTHTTRLKSLKFLKKYTNLKFLKLYNMQLDAVKDTFPDIFLDKLILNRVHGVKDVSWLFTFGGIHALEISSCNEITTIHTDWNTDVISRIDIRSLSSLTSIDALFNLDHLESLQVRYCPKLMLPSTDVMYKTPHMMLAGKKYHLYKEKGVWKKITYY